MTSDRDTLSGRARLEVLVEPFTVNDPGPHVTAAIKAIEAAGLVADMGPFATITEGDFDQVMLAMNALTKAGFLAGADAIQIRIELVDLRS